VDFEYRPKARNARAKAKRQLRSEGDTAVLLACRLNVLLGHLQLKLHDVEVVVSKNLLEAFLLPLRLL